MTMLYLKSMYQNLCYNESYEGTALKQIEYQIAFNSLLFNFRKLLLFCSENTRLY